MLLQELQNISSAFSRTIQIVPGETSRGAGYWMTALIGANGARKSLLLRLAMQAGLSKQKYFGYGHKRIDFKSKFLDDAAPSNVIAISSTPWDRFPRGNELGRLSRMLSADSSKFVYIGQRAGTGNVSLRNSEVQLGFNLIEHSGELNDRFENLDQIFGTLGLRLRVGIRLQVGSAITMKASRKLDKRRFGKHITRFPEIITDLEKDKSLRRDTVAAATELAKQLIANQSERERVEQIVDQLHPSNVTFWLDPNQHKMNFGVKTVSEWRAMLYLGLVEIEGLSLLGRTADHFPVAAKEARRDSDLSSGQWNWLYNFSTLELEARDDSLILIDEPENSLHPTWQRQYPEMLAKILGSRKGCHAIIATHSVLLAASLPANSGNVQVLEIGKSASHLTESRSIQSHFGWSADDLYRDIFGIESSRSFEFTHAADKVLRLISGTAREGEVVADNDIELLHKALNELPDYDSIRSLLKAMLSRHAHSSKEPTV